MVESEIRDNFNLRTVSLLTQSTAGTAQRSSLDMGRIACKRMCCVG